MKEKGSNFIFLTQKKGDEKMRMEKRNISEKFYNGEGFKSYPSDVMTIKSTPRCLENSITVHITNSVIGTDEYLTLPNKLEAWKWLKECNEVYCRKVLYQIGSDKPIKYEDSMPYLHRFNKSRYQELTA